MIKLNIHEAKTHLSKYLERVEQGETIILCKRNVPIAEIRPVSAAPLQKRPLGVARGMGTILPSFFDDLPEDILAGFEGRDE